LKGKNGKGLECPRNEEDTSIAGTENLRGKEKLEGATKKKSKNYSYRRTSREGKNSNKLQNYFIKRL